MGISWLYDSMKMMSRYIGLQKQANTIETVDKKYL